MAASEHPLAAAILTGATGRGLRWPEATSMRAEPGIGVHDKVHNQHVFIGRPDAVGGTVEGPLARLWGEGKTVVVLARDGQAVGLLAVADQLRPTGRTVVAKLHELGIRRVVLLTGDHRQVAQAIGRAAGIDDWRAQLLPQDKSAVIRELADSAGPVAMVGDGINDAPALAVADIGIAMGASGSTLALETADVALMADELEKLPHAIQLARRAMRILRQNVALSLVAVVALVGGALAGLLSLTTGLLLNEGTALLIIANGLRLLHPRAY